MKFQEMLNQAVKDRLFWSVCVDLYKDTIFPTSKGGTCLEFYNLLANAGTYSGFLEIYINDFVSERYKDAFKKALDPQYLLSNLKDEKFCSVNYSMKTSHGNQRSMLITVFSADGDYNSGKCVITASSIDNEYNMLLELDDQEEKREDLKAKVQNIMLQSMGDMFYAAALIDLLQNKYLEIISGKGLHPTIRDENDPLKAAEVCVDVFVSEQDRSYMREFLNLKTLSARLEKQKSISATFYEINGKLVQISFLPVSRDEKDALAEVLLMVQIIDDGRAALKHQAILKSSLDDALKLAETDGMTQLLNRRSGEKYINQYLSNGGNGMFCLLDVDDFKHFNDVYGHDIADKILQGVSACIKKTFRNFDVLVRAGGDEFIIFALGLLGRETGEEKVQELKNSIAEMTIKEVPEKVSISVGTVYSSDFSIHDFNGLFKGADSLMYQEKALKK